MDCHGANHAKLQTHIHVHAALNYYTNKHNIPLVARTCMLCSGCRESSRKFSSPGFLHVRVSHASQRPVSNWLAVINPSSTLMIKSQSVDA